jgi:hypothetical protein
VNDKNIFAIISIAFGSILMAFAGLTAVGLCRKLERENAALLKALKEIADWGPHDGSCGYGCDSPGIAMAAIDAARKEAHP